MDTFKEKLDVGLAGEALTEYFLRDVLNKEVQANTGFSRSHDLLVNGKYVEVKTDIKSAITGKVALEHISLRSHTAPTILFLLPTWVWISRRKALELLDIWPDQVLGGDDNRLHTLIPKDKSIFNDYFRCLN